MSYLERSKGGISRHKNRNNWPARGNRKEKQKNKRKQEERRDSIRWWAPRSCRWSVRRRCRLACGVVCSPITSNCVHKLLSATCSEGDHLGFCRLLDLSKIVAFWLVIFIGYTHSKRGNHSPPPLSKKTLIGPTL